MKTLMLVLLSIVASTAFAQTAYPSKPIHIIVPFTAGSSTDVIGRAIGDAISKSLGQPVIVENKPGAGGTLGAAQVARSDPDGYTLLVHSAGHAVNQAIYPNLPYPHAGRHRCRARAVSRHAGGALRSQAGRIDAFFAPLVSALPLIKDGKVQALAVSTPARSAVLPDLPTTVEAGTAGSKFVFWVGMLVPAKTPRPIVRRLHDEVITALSAPDVKSRFATLGAEPMPMEPDAFDAFIRAEVEQGNRIAKAANLKPQ